MLFIVHVEFVDTGLFFPRVNGLKPFVGGINTVLRGTGVMLHVLIQIAGVVHTAQIRVHISEVEEHL